MPLIIRLGDSGSHGGAVITAATKWKCEGLPIARVGDLYNCPIPFHGINPIVSGSSKWLCEGSPIARDGDVTACGCVLQSGAQRWQCE